MIQTKKLLASLLSCNFLHLKDEIDKVEKAGIDMLHLDIMDGNFVPNITIGPDIVKQMKSITKVGLDVHLMLINPVVWVDKFIESGANSITVHSEADVHLNRLINLIKSRKVRAMVSINPATNPVLLDYILEYVDGVLVMSVNPGFGGQAFIENTFRKIDYLANIRLKYNYNFLIQVDGGISLKNVPQLLKLGVDEFIVGSALFSDNLNEFVANFKKYLRVEV